MNPHGPDTTPDRNVAFSWRHRVRFTGDAWDEANLTLVDAFGFDADRDGDSRALVVVDRGYLAARPRLQREVERYFAANAAVLPRLVGFRTVTGGESAKIDLSLLEGLLRDLHGFSIDRRSYVVAIGGGAVLDMVGFAAAVFHRGVRLIRLPTTTLAQADSGVGVKNAVNMVGTKNLIGTFAVPHAVVNDLAALRRLPLRVWRDGLAEAVKVALLKDPAFFDSLESSARSLHGWNLGLAEPIWQRSADLHLQHIVAGGDPFELDQSRPLDLGHWAAHRLEEITANRVSHGQAVAVGLALDLTYVKLIGLLPADVLARVLCLLADLGLPTFHPALLDPALPEGLDRFREHLGGKLCIPNLRGIGDPFELDTIEPDALAAAIHERGTNADLAAPVGTMTGP